MASYGEIRIFALYQHVKSYITEVGTTKHARKKFYLKAMKYGVGERLNPFSAV